MDKKANDFSVNSKGYCFICLNKKLPQFNPVKLDHTLDDLFSTVYSLQDISRYVKIDMRRVFIQGGAIPPHLLAKIERARLKVELCEECASRTEIISEQCRQLEKLKMEIETGLEYIHGKMTNADKAGRAEHFQRVVGSDGDSGMGGLMDILEVLRKETLQKCSRKVSKASPRLKVQRLTPDEIQRSTFRTHKEEASSEPMSDSELLPESTKPEKSVTGDWALEDDDHSESPFADDRLDYSIPTTSAKYENGPAEGQMSIREMEQTDVNKSQRKWIISPDTGKYKCQLCTAEYGSRNGAINHYDTVHRKLRFRCKICGREFRQQGHYKIHYQNVHLGIRFQCTVCKRIFTLKNDLRKHQKTAGCVI